jgi:hypothetical protein
MAMGFAAAMGIAAVVSLVIFLVTKELASAHRSGPSLRVAKFVNAGIWPLTAVFAILAGTKIFEVLS